MLPEFNKNSFLEVHALIIHSLIVNHETVRLDEQVHKSCRQEKEDRGEEK